MDTTKRPDLFEHPLIHSIMHKCAKPRYSMGYAPPSELRQLPDGTALKVGELPGFQGTPPTVRTLPSLMIRKELFVQYHWDTQYASERNQISR